MKNFKCVNCGSDNIQIVRGVYESETEARYQADLKDSAIDELFSEISQLGAEKEYKKEKKPIKNPTIGELLASDPEVSIKTQSRIAERLGSIDLPVHIQKNHWGDFVDNLKNYLDKKELLQHKREKLENLKLKKPTRPIKPTTDGMLGGAIFLLFLSGIIFFIGLTSIDLSNIILALLFIAVTLFFFGTSVSLFDDYGKTKNKIKNFGKALKTYEKTRDKYLNEIEPLISSLEIEVEKLEAELNNIENKAKDDKYNFNKKGNEEARKKRKQKIDIWSNLYYCHRCDTVMDLESQIHNRPENINELVEKLM